MKNLIPPFIEQQFARNCYHGYISGYVLFTDLSGFTPLTEELMQQGPAGAELLSGYLNQIFEPLVNLVYLRGGFIPYFAGDSFTAIFPQGEQGGLSAGDVLETAIEARELFRQRGNRFGKYTIGIKTGLSYGQVEWGIIGEELRSFYFRGEPIDRAAYCQTQANDLDIILDDILRERLDHRRLQTEEVSLRSFRLTNYTRHSTRDYTPVPPHELSPEVARHFLPEAIVEYNQVGEFRVVVSVFISFEGVDTHDLLNQFVSVVLNQVNNFSGYLKEVDFGDKGGVLPCFFGAPVSYENNVARALEFVMTVREELRILLQQHPFHYRIGITAGTAFTGIVGGKERCQYACVGNRVNLAARIMSVADWGEVLVGADVERAVEFRFLHKGDIKYKGFKNVLPTFKLIGRNFRNRVAFSGEMIERSAELSGLLELATPIVESGATGRLIYLYGEAGIGKSRITYEMQQLLQSQHTVQWFFCQTDQILRKPFNPFIYFLRNYFEQSPDNNLRLNRANFSAQFNLLLTSLEEVEDRRVDRVTRELRRTEGVLMALLGIATANSIWDQLDARGRYQNTIATIVNVFVAESLISPVVIHLEDAHWIDDNSLELIGELARRMATLPILLLITSRYNDDGTKPNVVAAEVIERTGLVRHEIDLTPLPADAVRAFANRIVGGAISDEFFDLLQRTTNNNPFYLEQVLEYFMESKLVEEQDGEWIIHDQTVQLSNSINAILMARIDRLSSLVRETVKAAAVIGREFELPVLTEVMRNHGEFSGDPSDLNFILREQIDTAEQGQIWMAMNELRYIFKHSLLREAVYSMQLRARLQELHHQIAQAIERLYGSGSEERYIDLAFHYEQAGVADKTNEYLNKAADYARRNYQNQQALDFYERLLQKMSGQDDRVEEINILLKRGAILRLIGEWQQAHESFTRALKLAKKSRDVLLLGKANNSLGYMLMLQGEYAEATRYLQTAAGLFESIDDQVGIARVYGNLGNLDFRQAKYEKALEHFVRSLSTGYANTANASSAQIVANLGLTYMNRGQYEDGIRVIRQQLSMHQQQNDQQGLATLYTNLGIVYYEQGDYTAALDSYQRGLELAEELDNKQLIAIAVGCIGSVYERQGKYEQAMAHFERDLALCEELGDKQGIAIALGLLGELHSVMGNFAKAIDHLQKNLMLCEELNYQKGIAKAVNTLGDVFYFTGQYTRSLEFYDRAILITRQINNWLVLGSSLVEKGAVLIALERIDELAVVRDEALKIAHDLGNIDLLIEAQVLDVHTHYLLGEMEAAQALLDEMMARPNLTQEQQAAIYYTQWRVDPQHTVACEQAQGLYQTLNAATPKYVYQRRLDQLTQDTE